MAWFSVLLFSVSELVVAGIAVVLSCTGEVVVELDVLLLVGSVPPELLLLVGVDRGPPMTFGRLSTFLSTSKPCVSIVTMFRSHGRSTGCEMCEEAVSCRPCESDAVSE